MLVKLTYFVLLIFMLSSRDFVDASGSSICGQTFEVTVGKTKAVNYLFDTHYPANQNCVFYLRGTGTGQLIITFTTLDLQSGTCSKDYLEVYDGPSSMRSRSIKKLCGSKISQPIETQGNRAALKFVSDGSVHKTGFSLQFTTTTAGNICGKTFDVLSRQTRTVNYMFDTHYPANQNCVFHLRGKGTGRLIITFSILDLEEGSCSKDYIQVFDGPTTSSPSIQKLCGSKVPVSIETQKNIASLKFVSDGSVHKRGFILHFTTTSLCNRTFEVAAGQTTTVNYMFDTHYPANQKCLFHLRGAGKGQLIITFQAIDIEDNGCRFDNLNVYDGPSTKSTYIKKLCGSKIPVPIETKENQATLVFVSDKSVHKTGFILEFTTTATVVDLCGQTFEIVRGQERTVNYLFDTHYPAKQNCVFHLNGTGADRLLITFTSFDLEGGSSCKYDYLQMYDGPSTSSTSGEKLCGSKIPASFETQRNVVTLRFVSDGSVQKTGFSLQFAAVIDCSWSPWAGVNCVRHGKNDYRIVKTRSKSEAKNGGKDCEGTSEKEIACDTLEKTAGMLSQEIRSFSTGSKSHKSSQIPENGHEDTPGENSAQSDEEPCEDHDKQDTETTDGKPCPVPRRHKLTESATESPDPDTAPHKDILFLVDESGSVGEENFKLEMKLVKALTKQFCGKASIGMDESRVGMATFDKEFHLHFDFTEHVTTEELDIAMNEISYNHATDGGTCLTNALNRAKTDLFDKHGRPNFRKEGDPDEKVIVDRVIMLISDGCPNCDTTGFAKTASDLITSEGITFFTFLINSNENCLEIMKALARRDKDEEIMCRKIFAASWEELNTIAENMNSQNCIDGTWKDANLAEDECPDD